MVHTMVGPFECVPLCALLIVLFSVVGEISHVAGTFGHLVAAFHVACTYAEADHFFDILDLFCFFRLTLHFRH